MFIDIKRDCYSNGDPKSWQFVHYFLAQVVIGTRHLNNWLSEYQTSKSPLFRCSLLKAHCNQQIKDYPKLQDLELPWFGKFSQKFDPKIGGSIFWSDLRPDWAENRADACKRQEPSEGKTHPCNDQWNDDSRADHWRLWILENFIIWIWLPL